MAEGWSSADLAGFLGEHPFFSLLTPSLRRWLAARVPVERARAGEMVLRQGDDATAMYLVLSGRLDLVLEGPAGPVVTGSVGQRGSVGEIGVLTGEPHPASARAARDCELVVIERSLVVSLVQESRSFSGALLRFLGTILAEAEGPPAAPATKRSVIAVVPVGESGRAGWLRDELVGHLRRWGEVAVQGPPVAGRSEADDEAEAARRLGELEDRSDVVVLVPGGDHGGAWWRDFCVRQADRVVTVVGHDPRSGGVEASPVPGCDVVFVDSRTPPGARQRWLDELSARAHHNVTDASGVAAMARRLTGRSIGVVLSGGGARGLAHLGALAALEERHLTFDRIGGTSMGAFVGALWATGRDTAEIRELLHQELVERRPFNDYTLPTTSLARGRRARAMMDRLFGDAAIEDLPVDFFCVTADLVAGEEVVQRRGAVWLHVGASMSIPGWAPPMPFENRVLVDGGVLNNFPVDAMHATVEGPIVGVEAMGMSRADGAAGPAGAAARLPNLGEVLAGATTLGSRRRAEDNATRAAVVVRPDVGAVGLMDFGQLDRLIEIGRRDTLAALDDAPPVVA